MRRSIWPALALGAVLVASSAQATEEARARHHHPHDSGHHPARTIHNPEAAHRAPRPTSPAIPTLNPHRRPGEGNSDGLSRDPEDCVTGCVGGNPG